MIFTPTLFKKLWRDLVSRRFRMCGLCLAIGLGAGYFGAVKSTFESVRQTLQNFYSETHFQDLEVVFLPEDAANLPNLKDIDGIAKVEKRLVLPASITVKNARDAVSGLLILEQEDRPQINERRLLEGRSRNPEDLGSLEIERSLSVYHSFHPGDAIALRVGAKEIRGTISGVSVSPEFFAMSSNPNFIWPEKGTLGVIYGSYKLYSESLGFALINDLVFTFRPGVSTQHVKRAILDKLGGLAIDRVQLRDHQFSHRQITFNIDGFERYAYVMVAILLALSFFVASLTSHRLVLEHRREIGVLRSVGYPSRMVSAAYFAAAAVIGLISGLIACIFAYLAMHAFLLVLANYLGLPFLKGHLSLTTIGSCLCMSIGISVFTLLWPLLALLRKTPREMLCNEFIEHVPSEALMRFFRAILRALPISIRYGAGNLLRRPGLAFFAVGVTSFSIAVSISYAVCTSSFNGTLRNSLEEERWDGVVDLSHPMLMEEVDALSLKHGLSQTMPYLRGVVEVGCHGVLLDARLLGYETSSPLRTVHLVDGTALLQGNEIILSSDLSRDLGCRTGDTIDLLHQGVTTRFQVKGVARDANMRQVIIPLKSAQDILGMVDRASGLYFRAKSNSPMKPDPAFANYTSYAHLAKMLQKMKHDVLYIVYVAMGFGFLMMVVFIVMFLSLTIEERKAEYGMFLSLGYSRREIGWIVLSEVSALMIASMVLSLPLAFELAFVLNRRMSESFVEIQMSSTPWDIIIPMSLCLGCVAIAAVMGTANIFRLRVVEVLRARSIG
jgi:putative ABC transport system permease protein